MRAILQPVKSVVRQQAVLVLAPIERNIQINALPDIDPGLDILKIDTPGPVPDTCRQPGI